MRLLFLFVHMLLLQYCFMASLDIKTVKNIRIDQSSLLEFKAHVADPRGVLANNWSVSYQVCSWVGITCGRRHHRVTALNLSDMSLGGTIPPHLGNLSFLVYLDISYNTFHGHLPNELGQLHRLRLINFTFNELSGSFPSWIGTLSQLQTLRLRNNSFTGHIPMSLFNLSNLVCLDTRFNIIDGGIPSKIGNLSKLMLLNLGENKLQGTLHPPFFDVLLYVCRIHYLVMQIF